MASRVEKETWAIFSTCFSPFSRNTRDSTIAKALIHMQCSDEEISVMPIKHFYTANRGQKFYILPLLENIASQEMVNKVQMRKASEDDLNILLKILQIGETKLKSNSFCPEISNFVFSVWSTERRRGDIQLQDDIASKQWKAQQDRPNIWSWSYKLVLCLSTTFTVPFIIFHSLSFSKRGFGSIETNSVFRELGNEPPCHQNQAKLHHPLLSLM